MDQNNNLPFELNKSIEYQEASVVSKTLIKQKTGSLTVFAFDKGQELSEHTAPFDAYVQIVHGEAEITISGKPYYLTKGQSIIMPANKPHSLHAVNQFKMLLVMIKS